MVKIKMFFDKDKETRWLNAMMAEGYAMTGYFLIFYIFNNTDPGLTCWINPSASLRAIGIL